MILVMPASANTVHRLAVGSCSDLLSLVVAATKAPVVIAPTMNPSMFNCPAIKRNINQLRMDGYYVMEPGLAIEVSHGSSKHLVFGGIGVPEQGIQKMLTTLMTLHKNNVPRSDDHKSKEA